MAPASVEAMAGLIGASSEKPTESFFDLGSGTGRLVMHMAVKGYAQLATGVELNSARHAFAVDLAESALPAEMPRASGALNDTGPWPVSGVHLFHGSMLDANISTATVLYMNPACLSCATKRQLLRKVLEECPKLQYILTTSPLPGLLASGFFEELQTEALPPMIGYEWKVPVTLYRHRAHLNADQEAETPVPTQPAGQSLRR